VRSKQSQSNRNGKRNAVAAAAHDDRDDGDVQTRPSKRRQGLNGAAVSDVGNASAPSECADCGSGGMVGSSVPLDLTSVRQIQILPWARNNCGPMTFYQALLPEYLQRRDRLNALPGWQRFEEVYGMFSRGDWLEAHDKLYGYVKETIGHFTNMGEIPNQFFLDSAEPRSHGLPEVQGITMKIQLRCSSCTFTSSRHQLSVATRNLKDAQPRLPAKIILQEEKVGKASLQTQLDIALQTGPATFKERCPQCDEWAFTPVGCSEAPEFLWIDVWQSTRFVTHCCETLQLPMSDNTTTPYYLCAVCLHATNHYVCDFRDPQSGLWYRYNPYVHSPETHLRTAQLMQRHFHPRWKTTNAVLCGTSPRVRGLHVEHPGQRLAPLAPAAQMNWLLFVKR
jgi:hypothetical protein